MSHVTPASAALHSDLFSVRAQLQTVKGTDSARDGDVHVVKNRPEADVELHFQARLHVMNLVRGFHHQRSVIVEIDVAAVAAQEESERGSKFVVIGPHPEYRHRLGGEGEAGRPAGRPPHKAPGSRRIGAQRFTRSFLDPGGLTHPPSVGSPAYFTSPNGGCACVAPTLR